MTTLLFWGIPPDSVQESPADRYLRLMNRYMTVTLPALYRTERGRQDLESLYGIFARVDSLLLNIRDQVLAKIADPDQCESLFLEHLASVVGIDDNTPWFRLLTADEKRRIIAQGAILWATKGTGYRLHGRAVAGRKCWFGDWHALRELTVGEAGFYELEDPLGPADAEYRTFVHHVNAGGLAAETLDLAFESFRPVLERIVRQEVYFLDDFMEGLGQWTRSGSGTLTLVDGLVTLENENLVPQKVLSDYYTMHVRFQIPDGEYGIVQTNLNGGGDGYWTVLQNGVVALFDSVTGLLAVAAPEILPGYTHSVRIEHRPTLHGTEVRVILNGNDVLTYTPGVGAPSYTPGGFLLGTGPGQRFSVALIEALQST